MMADLNLSDAERKPMMEYRVRYEFLYPGLGWREKTEPSFYGWEDRGIAEMAVRAYASEPDRYRSIIIESRPIPEEWRTD